MSNFTTDALLGPTGGLMAIIWAAGCSMGYGFAKRTAITQAKARIKAQGEIIKSQGDKIAKLEKKVEELNELVLEEVRNQIKD